MNLFTLLGLVTLAVFVDISRTELCLPDQWQGFYIWKALTLKPHTSFDTITTHMFSDAKNLRQAAYVSHIYYKDDKRSFFQISLYGKSGKGRTLYDIDLHTNLCVKTVYPEDTFDRQCVPDNTTNLGDSFLGVKGQGGIEVTTYKYQINGTENMLTAKKVGSNLIPIHTTFFNKNHMALFDVLNYNSTIGIKDPSIFDIPKQCQQGVVEQPADTPLDKEMRDAFSFSNLF